MTPWIKKDHFIMIDGSQQKKTFLCLFYLYTEDKLMGRELVGLGGKGEEVGKY